MPVPLMDIRGQYVHLLDDVKRAACDVIDSGRFILGPNVRALEEEAQAYGARCDGRPVGTFGDAATLSFFPSKNLPAMGDGGMVLLRDRDVADRVRMLRFHGSRDKRI